MLTVPTVTPPNKRKFPTAAPTEAAFVALLDGGRAFEPPLAFRARLSVAPSPWHLCSTRAGERPLKYMGATACFSDGFA